MQVPNSIRARGGTHGSVCYLRRLGGLNNPSDKIEAISLTTPTADHRGLRILKERKQSWKPHCWTPAQRECLAKQLGNRRNGARRPSLRPRVPTRLRLSTTKSSTRRLTRNYT